MSSLRFCNRFDSVREMLILCFLLCINSRVFIMQIFIMQSGSCKTVHFLKQHNINLLSCPTWLLQHFMALDGNENLYVMDRTCKICRDERFYIRLLKLSIWKVPHQGLVVLIYRINMYGKLFPRSLTLPWLFYVSIFNGQA